MLTATCFQTRGICCLCCWRLDKVQLRNTPGASGRRRNPGRDDLTWTSPLFINVQQPEDWDARTAFPENELLYHSCCDSDPINNNTSEYYCTSAYRSHEIDLIDVARLVTSKRRREILSLQR